MPPRERPLPSYLATALLPDDQAQAERDTIEAALHGARAYVVLLDALAVAAPSDAVRAALEGERAAVRAGMDRLAREIGRLQ